MFTVINDTANINSTVYSSLIASNKILTNSKSVSYELSNLGLAADQSVKVNNISVKNAGVFYDAVVNVINSTNAADVAKAVTATLKNCRSKGSVWVVATMAEVDDQGYRTFDSIKDMMIAKGAQSFEVADNGHLVIMGITGSTGNANLFSGLAGVHGTGVTPSVYKAYPGESVYVIRKAFANTNNPISVTRATYAGNRNDTSRVTFTLPRNISDARVNAVLNNPETREFLRDLKGDMPAIQAWHLSRIAF